MRREWKRAPGRRTIAARSPFTPRRAFLAGHESSAPREPFASVLKEAELLDRGLGVSPGGRLMAGLVSRLPTGVLLCTCRLVDCFRTDDVQCTSQDKIDTLGAVEGPWLYITEQEARFGDYSRGRYAWLLADVQPLKEPIPARGALGLWETDLL